MSECAALIFISALSFSAGRLNFYSSSLSQLACGYEPSRSYHTHIYTRRDRAKYSVTFWFPRLLTSFVCMRSGDTLSESTNYCFSHQPERASLLMYCVLSDLQLGVSGCNTISFMVDHGVNSLMNRVHKTGYEGDSHTARKHCQCQRKQIGANCQGRNHFDLRSIVKLLTLSVRFNERASPFYAPN